MREQKKHGETIKRIKKNKLRKNVRNKNESLNEIDNFPGYK